eukprot:TRINITY_DN47431_c0_g1_i1.p1 TRINITY_DN47431_c0_g1~~TRINITY_DN47431_c0_g1_i1.p1  ORF type:complete len:412 (+),score=167.17 TRINITY_DN47431_c0_g1_i1:96-1238(+)
MAQSQSVAAQLAEVRRRRAQECAQQRAEEKAQEAAGAPAPEAKKTGKVIGGKYFANPPQQMGMKELEEIVNRYQRVQRQKDPTVQKFGMDTDSADFFQSFLRRRQFQLMRYGIMYGKVAGGVVQCHSIYEPEQHGGPTDFEPQPDKHQEEVDKLASLLGLQRVGVITSAPPLSADAPILSAREVLLCAEQQAKFGPHCCIVQIRLGEDGQELRVEAYQTSSQCVDIYKEGTLSMHPEKRGVVHSERQLEAVQEEGSGAKRAMVSKQPTFDVDTLWFTVPVPITSFTAPHISNRFVRLNRPGEEPPVWENVKVFLQDPKRKDKPFVEQLGDFHLLVFVATHLANLSWRDDWPIITKAVLEKDSSGKVDGYMFMIKHLAGMD